MSNWIEVNIPWKEQNISITETKPYPDLSKEVKDHFGYTKEELAEKFFPRVDLWFDHPAFKEYKKVEEELCSSTSSDEELTEALVKSNNQSVNSVLEFKKKREEIVDWEYDHPAMKAVHEANEKIWKEQSNSFCGEALNKTGTLIEFERDGKIVRLLIGDINELGGVCDDCVELSDDTIILRYKVLNLE